MLHLLLFTVKAVHFCSSIFIPSSQLTLSHIHTYTVHTLFLSLTHSSFAPLPPTHTHTLTDTQTLSFCGEVIREARESASIQ